MAKKIKFTKEQKKILKRYWEHIEDVLSLYSLRMDAIENQLQEKLCIDIEIFHVDGYPCGYGTYDREYELLNMPECKYEEDYER